jgi:uncharacterized protein (TIGR00730 family)
MWKIIKDCLYFGARQVKAFYQLVKGSFKIARMHQPIVTIFGGAAIGQDHPYAKQARLLGAKLVERDVSVLTGGGPGIMEAANCGAIAGGHAPGLRSVGVGVKGLGDEQENLCSEAYIEAEYFFVRKWLLMQYSKSFGVFPGGWGTIDELGEVVTLIKTHKMDMSPIVLFGSDYWKPFMQWVNVVAIPQGFISEQAGKLITVTDDLDEMADMLVHCASCGDDE